MEIVAERWIEASQFALPIELELQVHIVLSMHLYKQKRLSTRKKQNILNVTLNWLILICYELKTFNVETEKS